MLGRLKGWAAEKRQAAKERLAEKVRELLDINPIGPGRPENETEAEQAPGETEASEAPDGWNWDELETQISFANLDPDPEPEKAVEVELCEPDKALFPPPPEDMPRPVDEFSPEVVAMTPRPRTKEMPPLPNYFNM